MEEQATVVIDIQLQESEVSKRLAEVNGQMAALRKENSDLKKSVKDGEKTWKDVSVQLAANEAKIKSLKTEQSALSGQVAKATQTSRKYGDSLKEQSALLADLKNQYQSMTAAEREGAEGQELLKHIQELDEAVKAADYSQGNFQRNVGNYPDAVKPVTAQLREMTQELIRLRMEGKANTEEYDQLLRKTGEMKDAMEDANNEIKQMSSDTGTLNSVLGGAQAAAGAFSVALGVMNLVGDKDSKTAKELAEAQQKLQAAIAITTGLQAVQNALQKESALMMGVNKIRLLAAAAAQKAYAAATRDAEAAQVVFNRVAKSNIYVWLAGVILTVVGAIAAFTRGSKDQEEELEKVNFQLKKQLDYLNELNEMYRSVADVAIRQAQERLDMLKAQGAETDKIREAENALLEATRKSIEAEEQRLGYSEQNYNFLVGKYAVALDRYNARVEEMQAQVAAGRADLAAFMQDQLEADKLQLDGMRQQIGLFDEVRQRRQEYRVQFATIMKERNEEITKQTTHVKKAVAEVRRETLSLLEIIDSEELYSRMEERNRRLADSLQKVADRVGILKEEFEQLDPNKFGSSFVSDENLTDSTTKMELWAESYKDNAEAIMETSTALESSFGSVSQMYQQMAKDESKTEEERAKAASRAKAWSKIQIATNAGVAVAKGVASAVDVGFPAAIPAMATMLAAILSAIAQAKALASEGFETGGVIGGYRGATMGNDNTSIDARTGEMVLNAEQQRRLFEIANGGMTTNLTAQLVSALQAMPAPVLDYKEFTEFEGRVASINELAKIQ